MLGRKPVSWNTRACVALVLCLAFVVSACGGSGGEGDADKGGGGERSESAPSGSIGDRSAGPDDYVMTSPVSLGEVVIFADEAQAGLEAVEQYLYDRNPEASADVECWLMVQEDGTIAQAMRCGPYVEASGRASYASYPFSADEQAQDEGRLELKYEARLIGEVEPFIGSVELVRPDGKEAPDDAFSDVIEGSETPAPEAPEACAASGTVTDGVYGTFVLESADLLEVSVDVEEFDLEPGTYLHRYTVLSWNDAEGRGVYLGVRVRGFPGEEAVESVTVDLDKSSRAIMEANGNGNPGTANADELPAVVIEGWDPATGGTITADITIEGRYSYDEDNVASVDVTVTCE